MAKCTNCGTNCPDGINYCPECGTPLKNDYTQKGRNYFQDAVNHESYTNREDTPFSNDDIQRNKVMAALSYIGAAVLIPLFLVRNSPYTRYHANQGLVLFIAECIYTLIRKSLSALGSASFLLFGFKIASFFLGALELLFLCLAIMGIVQVCSGQAKPLPLIGKIKIIK
ncbi:MAG: zinc-ribbon domain-containing protein [Blautia sp.]|jgi:uncharacterized membrane protein